MECRERRTPLRIVPLAAMLIVAAGTVAPDAARAGGLFVTEMGTPDLGMAAAGRASTADNAATAFGNPAGMTRLEGSHLLVGLQGGYGIVEFDRGSESTVSGGNGGNASGGFPGAGFYAVYSLTPDIKLGLSTGSNFGGDVQYEKGWSGRYYATKDELVTFGVWPVAAYKVYTKDGRMEPIRGLAFDDVSIRSLRDIYALGKESRATNMVVSLGAPGMNYRMSVVTPDVLVEEMEFKSAAASEPRMVGTRP